MDITADLPLTGPRISLTSISHQDLRQLGEFFNDIKSLRYYLPTSVRPFNGDQLEKLMLDWNDGISSFVFAVKRQGTLIGLVNLDDLDWANGHAEVGIALVDSNYRGQGYAQETLKLLIDYAFGELGLHRLWARIIQGNQASMKLFELSGFIKEGVMKEHVRRSGSWLDMTIWGLINTSKL